MSKNVKLVNGMPVEILLGNICISLDLIGWLSINALVRAHNTRIMDLFNFLM